MAVNKGKTRVMVTFTDETLAMLDAYCKEVGMTRSSALSQLVFQNMQSRDALMKAAAEAMAEKAMNLQLANLDALGVDPKDLTAAQLASLGVGV